MRTLPELTGRLGSPLPKGGDPPLPPNRIGYWIEKMAAQKRWPLEGAAGVWLHTTDLVSCQGSCGPFLKAGCQRVRRDR